MNLNLFNSVAADLFARHYGVSFHDTMFADQGLASTYINNGFRPLGAVNGHAMLNGLARIDGGEGDLGKAEENAAIARLGVSSVNAGLVTCPHCHSRASMRSVDNEFDVFGCINTRCGHEFAAKTELVHLAA